MFEKVSNHVSRMICPMQSTGQVGKSTVLSSIIEYLKATEITCKAIDADNEHRTLSTWYENAEVIPFDAKNDLLAVLGALGDEKAQVVDFPAQATSTILNAFIDFDAVAFLSEQGIRVTIVLFANQDQAGMIAAADIYHTLGRTVDYLIVENPVKFGSSGFWRSRLGEAFANDPKILLPTLPDDIVYSINLESKKHSKVLNFVEAADYLDGLERSALRAWKKEVFGGLHNAARFLLPVGHPVGEHNFFDHRKAARANPLDLY